MKDTKTKKIRTPLGQRLRRLRTGALPFVIWVGALGVAGVLWRETPQRGDFVGIAEGQEAQLSAPFQGQLKQLHVELHQPVQAGQLLASLDDAGLGARFATQEAELRRLSAQLSARRAELEWELRLAQTRAETQHAQALSTAGLEYPAELRAFHADESRLSLGKLESQLARALSELESERIEARLVRAKALVLGAAGPARDVEDLALELDQERAKARSLERLAEQQTLELREAKARREALLKSYVGPPLEFLPEPALEALLEGLRAALEVQGARLEELRLQREQHLLRAPAAGHVASIEAHAGQQLQAGQPILTLVQARPDQITLWLPESSAHAPHTGQALSLARQGSSARGKRVPCRVESLGPRIESLPARLWARSDIPEYGRLCKLSGASQLGLLSGERVWASPLP